MPNPLKQCSLNVFKGMKLPKIWFCFQGIPESEEAPLTNISGVGSGAEQAAPPPASGGPNASPLDLFPQVRVWYFCGLIKSLLKLSSLFMLRVCYFHRKQCLLLVQEILEHLNSSEAMIRLSLISLFILFFS